jgi:hypothetical protein
MRGAFVVLASFLVLLSGCSSSGPTPVLGQVRELHSISELQRQFNSDNGRVRLVLLISPT